MPSTAADHNHLALTDNGSGWNAQTESLDADSVAAERDTALPPGSRLREYEIRHVIGSSRAGTVYQAWDHSLRRLIALKEYLPEGLAARGAGGACAPVSASAAPAHAAGLQAFAAEARVLASAEHGALVKVYRFWEEDGVAYMVMPYYEGPSLQSVLDVPGRLQDEAEVRSWLRPVLGAVGALHAQGHFHLHIGADNILLTASGPVLLDAGSAGRCLARLSGDPETALKHGYAAPEQYAADADTRCAAPADFYALAAVAYRAIAGVAPPRATERVATDAFVPLADLAGSRCSLAFAQTIDRLLAVSPEARPGDIAEFRQWVGGLETHASPLALEDAFDPMSTPFDSAQPDLTQPELTDPVTTPEQALLTDPALPPARPLPEPPAALASPLALGNGAGAEPFMRPRTSPARRAIAVGFGLAGVAATAALVVGLGGRRDAATDTAGIDRAAATPTAPSTASSPQGTGAGSAGAPRMGPPGASGAATAAALPRAGSSLPAVTLPTLTAPTPPRSADASRTPNPPAALPTVSSTAQRCDDILYEATLRRLSSAETAFLKKGCR